MEKQEVHRFGSTLYPEMLEDIDKAKNEIFLEYYIVKWDRIGKEFFRGLCRAAERGVEVKVIIDGFGSWNFPERAKKKMRDLGVELIHYNPVKLYKGIWKWILRDHRKIMVVDGKKAYIGGMNIDRKHLKPCEQTDTPRNQVIKDTHLEVEGKNTVVQIRNEFAKSWNAMKKEKELEIMDVKPEKTKILGGNIKTEDSILKEYVKKIRKADKSIKLVHSYFVPQKIVRRSLYDAVDRGVDVELITPAYFSEVRIARHATKNLYGELIGNGVEVYEYIDSFLHSKTCLIDDSWMTVGSMNLDFQGVLTNREINLFTENKESVNKMKKGFEEDLEKSVKITKKHLEERNWLENQLNQFFYSFRSLY